MEPAVKDSKGSYWLTVGLAGLVTVALWQVPYGREILWPFTLLATWVHEMGHGLGGMLLSKFISLEVFYDGSGVAKTAGASGWRSAIISAMGLLGPAALGSLFIVFGQTRAGARALIFSLGLAMVLSSLLCMPWGMGQQLFGIFVVASWGVALGALALYGKDGMIFFAAQLLAVQLCINAYRDLDYMFSPGAKLANGQVMPSDSAAIGLALGFGPYWFWGLLVATLSIAMPLSALWYCHGAGSSAKD